VSRSWWPFRRRSGKSKQSKSDGEQVKDKQLDETRRIARHVARQAFFSEDASESEPEPEPERPQGPTVTVYGNVVHVNFHKMEDLINQGSILRKDPVTRKIKRVAKRFDRSDVFYTKDGKLIDDETPPDDPYPLERRRN
jgi:hypothetical protein